MSTPLGKSATPTHSRGVLAGASKGNTHWQRRRTVRTLASAAHDPGELAEWLEMLGLDAREGR